MPHYAIFWRICSAIALGGTAGVIIPQGVLFSSAKAFKFVRKLLLERCDLKAVISMPGGVFKPYAGVSTSILIFTKVWGPKDKIVKPATEQVWFYDMADDGYSLDDKRSKKSDYGDLQNIVEKYHCRDHVAIWDRTSKYFSVSREEIEQEDYDLSFSRYKQNIYTEVEYELPSKIIEKLINDEVGDVEQLDLTNLKNGLLKELLDLKGMVSEK